jgi:hypothetical protein
VSSEELGGLRRVRCRSPKTTTGFRRTRDSAREPDGIPSKSGSNATETVSAQGTRVGQKRLLTVRTSPEIRRGVRSRPGNWHKAKWCAFARELHEGAAAIRSVFSARRRGTRSRNVGSREFLLSLIAPNNEPKFAACNVLVGYRARTRTQTS